MRVTALVNLCHTGNSLEKEKSTTRKSLKRVMRAQTGFAIGGVAPFGDLNPIHAFLTPAL